MSDIQTLVAAATSAVNQGRWDQAEAVWAQVLALDPRHPQALYSLGVHAFKRGQLGQALHSLQAAHASAPGDPAVLLAISVVLREQGDDGGELRAIEAALAADPYFLAALLAKAAHLEAHGLPKPAAAVYRNALKAAPPEPHWPPALRSQLLLGRACVERHSAELANFLSARTDAGFNALTPSEAERWREAIAIQSGQSQPYRSVSSQQYVPRLPAIPFYERSAFAWVEALEARTEAITAELRAVLDQHQAGFQPYVAYQPGTPLNQWQELNHSKRWSSYFLWNNGQPVTEHLERCPETAKALAAVGLADIAGQCPNAMFSVLAPHTHIPPHHGETNARLVVHLPLIVPDKCTYRVGFEHRRWNVGETLIFDDSIEHEARNDSAELRVVMIFDVWNPLLSPAERGMVKTMSAAMREFQGRA